MKKYLLLLITFGLILALGTASAVDVDNNTNNLTTDEVISDSNIVVEEDASDIDIEDNTSDVNNNYKIAESSSNALVLGSMDNPQTAAEIANVIVLDVYHKFMNKVEVVVSDYYQKFRINQEVKNNIRVWGNFAKLQGQNEVKDILFKIADF